MLKVPQTPPLPRQTVWGHWEEPARVTGTIQSLLHLDMSKAKQQTKNKGINCPLASNQAPSSPSGACPILPRPQAGPTPAHTCSAWQGTGVWISCLQKRGGLEDSSEAVIPPRLLGIRYFVLVPPNTEAENKAITTRKGKKKKKSNIGP